ncbi:hypothetical protein BDV25DRAFT_148264 [Aspergillus avenaceus]|uniref:Uncharacterized protein n=1 Tax=Aspergillus avenaceus TaxID=36643 RepID=A0A5N6U6A5_ASPAV|nr:hypothetical protein BDV25DRAFT_148264 [Aspergillus avenaceus]
MAPRLLSGKEIIQQPLPDLRVDEKYRTTSPSTQKLWFSANLSQWNIEQKARQYSDSIDWKDEIQSYACDKERLYCGDEHSVVARFNHNLCHTLTLALHRYVNDGMAFGDYKCAKKPIKFTKIPDIALITDAHDLCVVGEAKTPWKHDIVRLQRIDGEFRNFIGQIAQYMYKTKRKHGFLTTYEQTIFFQQVPHPKKKNVWVLCYSPVIYHNSKYEQVAEDKLDNPAYYRGKVTLAECFLYLAKRASEDRQAANSMEAKSWVGSDSSKINGEDDGHISFEEEGSSAEEGKKDEKDEKDKSQRMTRSTTRRLKTITNTNTLHTDTERLNIQGHSHLYSTLEWRGCVSIFFDRLEDKWYYISKGKHVHVHLHQDPDEGDFFVSGNYRYPVRKHQ